MQGAVVKKNDMTGRLKQRDNLKRQHSEVLKAGILYDCEIPCTLATHSLANNRASPG